MANLPQGFVLDAPTAAPVAARPVLPPGFVLEAPAPGVFGSDSTIGSRAVGFLEAGAAVGSGIIAEPVAGLVGIAQAINPFAEEGAGAAAVKATKEALTFKPRGDVGKGLLGSLGEILAPIGKGLKAAEKGLGGAAFEATGSPAAGAFGEIVPALALELLGLGAIKKGLSLKEAAKTRRLQKIKDVIENPTSAKQVEFRVVDGKRVPDRAAKEAIKQGFNAPTVAFAKGSSKADRAKFLQMTKIKRKALDDLDFASTNRASDVVGDSLSQRINHINKVNKSAGKRIDRVAQKLEGQTVDLSGARSEFISRLESEGVKFSPDPNTGKVVADYRGSTFQGTAQPQKAINQMLRRMDDIGDTADGLAAHRAKRFIDENVTFGGKAAEGLTGRSENIIKGLRKNIDSALDAKFRTYKRVNDTFSKTRNALDDFQSAAGQKIDLLGPSADKAVGTASRRLLSNAQSRANMLEAVKKLDRIAGDTGARFSDDIVAQAQYADILDSAFGTSAQRSLAGEVSKGVTGGTVIRSAVAPVASALETGIGFITSKKANPDRAFRALTQILSR